MTVSGGVSMSDGHDMAGLMRMRGGVLYGSKYGRHIVVRIGVRQMIMVMVGEIEEEGEG